MSTVLANTITAVGGGGSTVKVNNDSTLISEGGAVTEETRGGDVERDDLMLTLGKKKSELKAQKKKGKRGLRIDYGVSLPGSGKSGIAA